LSDLTALTEVWEGNSWAWTECTLGVDLINIGGGDIAVSFLHGDIMKIGLVSNNAATEESGFYSYPDKDGANNLAFSTTTYPKFLCRYKTSSANAAAGAAAKIVLAFNGYVEANSVDTNIAAGHAQEILTNSFSTTWKTAIGDITPTKTLDHILLFAECDTTAAIGTDYVYYDFVLVHKGTFTFPYWHDVYYDIHYKAPSLGIHGRDGDIEQKGGMKSPVIVVEGTMDSSDTGARWKDAPTTSSLAVRSLYGNRFYNIARGMTGGYREPWQWFTSDLTNCKVTQTDHPLSLHQGKELKEQREYKLRFKQFSLSSLGEADWDELEWAGQ